ncbi:MAG: S8 family serine peptidase [Spirochaetaceae bacterium]
MKSELFSLPLLFLTLILFAGCELFFGSDNDRPALGASVASIPDDPDYDLQWAHPAGDSSLAWGLMDLRGIAGNFEPVVVAVLDSLIDTTHPDLAGNVSSGGWDFIEEQSHDATMADGSVTPDSHGTHVAGIISSVHGNGAGIVGVGRNYLKILPIRVLDASQNGTSADLLAGILYAAGVSTTPRASVTAEVVNMSLGASGFLGSTIGNAIVDATAAGVTFIAASGNSNQEFVDYPAAYPGVIAVGSVDFTGTVYERSSFSNYGDGLDLVAPGGVNDTDESTIISTVPDSQLGYLQGTSMATPYVAGVAGLLYAWDRGISPEQVLQILQETATDIATSGRDEATGWGLVNANRALRRRLMAPYGPYEYDRSVSTYSSALMRSTTGGLSPEQSISRASAEPPRERVADSYILTVDHREWALLGETAGMRELEALLASAGGEIDRRIGGRFFALTLTSGEEQRFIDTLEAHRLVALVEPNYRVTLSRGAGQQPPERERVTVISRGNHSAVEQQGSFLVREREELARLPGSLDSAIRQEILDALQEYEAVALIVAGRRSTGGYAVELVETTEEAGVLRLDYTVREPEAGAIVPQVLTSPYLVLGISDHAGEVSFRPR